MRLHAPYGLPQREILLSQDRLFIRSAYGVWFAYVPGLGLRHMEMNGTNDRVQVEFLLNHFPDDGVFIDVGASYGYYALTIAKVKASSTCIAFEPAQRSCDTLRLNVAQNRLPNVHLVRSAVGERCEAVTGVGSPGDFAVAYVRPDEPAASYRLECTTIDRYVSEAALRRIDYIKMDIEGGELPALRGAIETIRRHKPIVHCELVNSFSTSRFGYRTIDALSLMDGLGYGFLYLTHDQYLREYGPLNVGNDPEQAAKASTEFFFVPRERIPSLNLATQFITPVGFPYVV